MRSKRLIRMLAMVMVLNLGTNFVCSAKEIRNLKNESISIGEKAVTGENLLKNSGFEEDLSNESIPGWKIWNGGSASIGIDTKNVYEGKKSAYIVENSSIAQVLTNLKPYTAYEYKAYVKIKDDGDSAILGVKDYGGEEVKKIVSGTEYTEYTMNFTTGNQTKAEVYLWDGSGLSANGKAFLDSVSISEIPYEGEIEVRLNVNDLEISIGERYELTSKVIPSSAINQDITYDSSNEDIVTVDSNGVITAIGSGQATITAIPDANGIAAQCIVNVTKDKQPWNTDNESKWTLVMEDEFEGNELDTSKWTVRGKEYKTYHRSDMVSVEDGKLKLGIDIEPDGQVVLGRIDNHGEDLSVNKTKFDQKYGFFEASAKVPPTEQTYFAFWTFNYPGVFNVDGTGKDGTEIDVTETVFQGDSTESTLHWDGYERWHKSTSSHRKPATNIHDGFHRYGLEWDEDTLKFYFDGKLTWTYEGPAVPWVKEILIFSSGLGMWGEGNINNAKLPYTSEVDWVRVYTKDGYENRVDETQPILYGLDKVKIAVDSNNNLLDGVWAVDNKDDESELTKNIIIDESTLDRTTIGVYNVVYSVTDSVGNTVSKEREIHVVDESEVKNKAFNGDFTNGTLDKWTVANQTGVNIDQNNAGIVNDEVTGNYAYVSPKKAAEQVVNIKADTTYRVKAKVKGENDSSRIEIGAEMYGREKKQAFISGEEWQEIEVEFTSDVEHTTGLVYVYNASNSGKIFFDDFTVEEIDNSDKEAPIINGVNDIRISLGSDFNPKAGITAIDNNDGDLTVWLDVKGKVDTNKVGTYDLTYYVKDIALNETTVTRTVIVYDENFNEINSIPEINGADDIKIIKGEIFDYLKGVSANDKEDGDITESITVQGEVDINTVGEYKVIYKVIDSIGAQKTIERIVTVIEEEIIVIDKSKLIKLIKKAESLDANKYTKDSWEVLDEALVKAKLKLEDKNLTVDELNKVEKELEVALSNLVYKTVDIENEQDKKPILPNTGTAVGSVFTIAMGMGLIYTGRKIRNKK